MNSASIVDERKLKLGFVNAESNVIVLPWD